MIAAINGALLGCFQKGSTCTLSSVHRGDRELFHVAQAIHLENVDEPCNALTVQGCDEEKSWFLDPFGCWRCTRPVSGLEPLDEKDVGVVFDQFDSRKIPFGGAADDC